MKRSIGFLFLFVLFLSACSEEAKAKSMKEMKSEIEAKEKELSELSESMADADKMLSESEALVDLLLEFYHTYPKETYAAGCLSKVHMTYSRLGEVEKAVAYGDTLLAAYPKYSDRAQIIESQIQSYEMLITPRNVQKIRSYLEMWLKENKNAPAGKIEDMKYHLQFVNMSLEERMRMNMESLD